MNIRKFIQLSGFIIFILTLSGISRGQKNDSEITVIRVPGDGIVPDVKVDLNGIVHVVYLKVDSAGNTRPSPGKVYYTHSLDGGEKFENPIFIANSRGDGLRGPRLALGRANRIHVLMPNAEYTRLHDNGKRFEPVRKLQKWSFGADGEVIAADGKGKVYVLFHAQSVLGVDGKVNKSGGEKNRRVVLARSINDGLTFSSEIVINTKTPMEVSACCGMAVLTDITGKVHLLYRDATNNRRDMYYTYSSDNGKRFQGNILSQSSWILGICPMTGTSLYGNQKGDLVAGWQTKKQIFLSFLNYSNSTSRRRIKATENEQAEYPVVAVNNQGVALIAWREKTQIRWQAFDWTGTPQSPFGINFGGNGRLSVCTLPDGRFLIVY